MDLVSRVQAFVLKPKEEWAKVKGESGAFSSLFTSFAMVLAAIPAIAQFIGFGLIGRRVPFLGWLRMGISASLFRALISYAFSLVIAYVFALLINALAPTFASAPNLQNALKLAVYGLMPYWVSGVLYLIPYLDVLVWLGSLYGFYLLYLGLDASLMETPKDKILVYFIACGVVIVVLMLISELIQASLYTFGVYRGI